MAAVNDDDFQGGAQGVEGVRSLTEMYRQKQQTRRMITICSAVTLLASCALMVFAPSGREKIAFAIGGVLAILSIGVIGLANFTLRYGKLQLRGGRVEPQNADKLWDSALGEGTETPSRRKRSRDRDEKFNQPQ